MNDLCFQFVPSFESDMSLTEKDGGTWLLKMFAATSDCEALRLFKNQLCEIVACEKPRAIALNYSRATVKFGHGRPDSIASVKFPKVAEVSAGAVHIAAVNGWYRLTEELLSNGVPCTGTATVTSSSTVISF